MRSTMLVLLVLLSGCEALWGGFRVEEAPSAPDGAADGAADETIDERIVAYGTLSTAENSGAAPTMTSCPLGTTEELALFQGLKADPGRCQGCECASSTPSCAKAKVAFHKQGDCADPLAGQFDASVTNTCNGVNAPAGTTHFQLTDSKTSCALKAGATGQPVPTYERKGLLCQPGGAACQTAACAAQQLASAGVVKGCVVPASTGPCPAPFTQQLAWSRRYVDARTCECACSAPVAECTGTWHAECARATVLPAGVCHDITLLQDLGTARALNADFRAPQDASCQPAAKVIGAAPVLADSVRLCCTP